MIVLLAFSMHSFLIIITRPNTGPVQNKKYNRAQTITNEDLQIEVLGLLDANVAQFLSLRTLSDGSEESATSITEGGCVGGNMLITWPFLT